MCAGAVREAVFSNPEVIRRINADFVPVTLSMLAFQAQTEDDEGKLLQSIYRSKVQPQGTCVLNSGGQVLEWVIMYDKNQSVLDFLDHGLQRFRDHPDAKQAIMTERYFRFTSDQQADMKDEAKLQPIAERHEAGRHCPGWVGLPRGTIVAKVIGRALDKDGKLSARTVNQEDLALDRFEVSPALQERLAKALADGGAGRRRLPEDFARLCMAHAFLGNKDAGPMSKVSVSAAVSDVKQCEFSAQKVEGSTSLWRVEGQTEVIGAGGSRRSFGYRNEVKLVWEGFIEMDGKRMTRFLLAACGTEKFQYGSDGLQAAAKIRDEVALLTAGRYINMECGVRYGILGEPAAANEVKDLVEGAVADFSASNLQDKMHRIQKELPAWVQKPGRQAQVKPLTEKLAALMKDKKWQEVDKTADAILSLMSPDEKK